MFTVQGLVPVLTCVHAALDQVLALKAPQLSFTQSTAPARISLKIRTLKAKLATITQRLDWIQVSVLRLCVDCCHAGNHMHNASVTVSSDSSMFCFEMIVRVSKLESAASWFSGSSCAGLHERLKPADQQSCNTWVIQVTRKAVLVSCPPVLPSPLQMNRGFQSIM